MRNSTPTEVERQEPRERGEPLLLFLTIPLYKNKCKLPVLTCGFPARKKNMPKSSSRRKG